MFQLSKSDRLQEKIFFSNYVHIFPIRKRCKKILFTKIKAVDCFFLQERLCMRNFLKNVLVKFYYHINMFPMSGD